MVKTLMHKQRTIIVPNDTTVDNMTVAEYMKVVDGKRIPVRAGHSIVGYVDAFRIDGDCVIGEFRER